MKKKLIFFSYDLNVGGIEKALVNLLNNINYDKYEVTLILEKKEGSLLSEINKNVILKEYKRNEMKLTLIKKIINIAKRILWSIKNKNKYDFSCCYATYSIIGSKLSRIASKNSSIYVHSDYTFLYKNELEFNQFFNKVKINEFKTVFFVSNESRSNFEKIYKLDNRKVVFNNFVDYNKILRQSNEKINEKKKGKQLVFVGRLDESSKKITKLLELVKNLKEKFDINLWIVGEGPNKSEYTNYCKKNNMSNFVKFVGSKKNPYPYIKKADYIILTSEYEGFPVIYLEAIVLKTKIITTIDVSDKYIKIPNNYGYIISKDLKTMIVQVSKIIENDNLKYKNLNFEKMKKEKMLQLEAIFDGVI